MAINYCCCSFINLKNADFKLGNSILWNAHIVPDRTILIKIFPGEHAPGPPSTSLAADCYSVTYAPAMHSSF